MPRPCEVHGIRYRVGGVGLYHERITLVDMPPSEAAILTVDCDVYIETVARAATSTPLADWPIKCPRTTQWCLEHMRKNAGDPLAWHLKWKAEARLRDSDPICQQHEMNCRLLDMASCDDELNTSELASFEFESRPTQLIEERHCE